MSNTDISPPTAMTMHKAIAAFLTALIALIGLFGIHTGWVTPDIIEMISTVLGALAVGVVTWLVPNKPKA